MNKPLFLPPRFVEKQERPTSHINWFNDDEDGMTIKDLEAEAALARLEETYGLSSKAAQGRPPRKNFYRKYQHSS